MNKEEIKHFKAMLRQGSLRHMNIILDDKFQKELLNIIKDYEKVQLENQQLKTQQSEFIKYLEDEKDRLARECSQIYEDSLGKIKLVNEDIFDEVNIILSRYKELIKGEEKQ